MIAPLILKPKMHKKLEPCCKSLLVSCENTRCRVNFTRRLISVQIFSDEEDNALQRIGGSGLGIDSVAAIFVSLPAGDFIESSINNGLPIICVCWF